MDECLEQDTCAGQRCWNTEGSFVCRPNYCAATTCPMGTYCFNTPYRATCPTDFCAAIRCAGGYKCVNRAKSGACVPDGLTRSDDNNTEE